MKLFKTGSAAVVSECQNFFRFLPISNQIDIRTAKFLEKFMTSDNSVDYSSVMLELAWTKIFQCTTTPAQV